jgi:signal transduction histidine kinase
MDTTLDLSWSHLAQFILHYTHDLRNDLNGLDLEAALLADFVPGGGATESLARIRAQIRGISTNLRGLAGKFTDPHPVCALYGARELFLIWQDQPAALPPAPAVQWSEAPGSGQVNVDAAALADVFRELLANAQAFGTGAPVFAAARVENRRVVFELREPKEFPLETASWGRAPLASLRHGHYGLGLWVAQRTVTAMGGEVRRRFAPDAMQLITTLLFPIA